MKNLYFDVLFFKEEKIAKKQKKKEKIFACVYWKWNYENFKEKRSGEPY